MYSVCPDANGLWTRSQLPLWDAGEDGWLGGWHFADQNDDSQPDLSIREPLGGDEHAYWRLHGQ
jgi:hypothetical protein